MRNLSFRGYAQRNNKGFNPLRIPDTSQKHLRDAERQLQGMREVQRSEINSRNERLSAIKENNQTEEAVRNENRRLEVQFAEAYQQAALQPLKVQIQDAKTRQEFAKMKSARDEKLWNQFKDLVPKAFSALGDIQERRLQAANEQAFNVVTKYGLTLEQLAYKDQAEKTLLATEAGTSELLRKNGGIFTTEQALAVGRMSGLEAYSAQLLLAKKQGELAFPEFYNTVGMNMDIGKPGYGTYGETLADTTRDNSAVLKTFYEDVIVKEFYKQLPKDSEGNDLYSTEFVAGEIRPWINKHKDKILAEITEKQNQYKGQTVKLNYARGLEAWISKGAYEKPGENFVDYYMAKASYNPKFVGAERRQAINQLVTLAESGQLPDGVSTKIQNTPISVGGAEPKPLGVLYAKEFEPLNKVYAERNKIAEEQLETKRQDVSLRMQNQWLQFRRQHQRPPTKNDIDQLKAVIETNGLDVEHKDFDWIRDIENMEQLQDAESDRLAEGLLKKGTLFEYNLYGDPRFTAATVEKYKDKTLDGLHQLENRGSKFKTGINQAIAGMGNKTITTTETRDWKTTTMGAIAQERLINVFNSKSMREEWPDAAKRMSEASIKVEQEIREGKGIFEIILQPDGKTPVYGPEGGWVFLKNRDESNESDKLLKQEAQKNRDYPFIKGNLSESQLKQIEGMRDTGKIPLSIKYLDQVYINQTPHDIANKILRVNGLEEIEPTGIAKADRFVSQEFKRLVTCHPSWAKTEICINQELKKSNPDVPAEQVVNNAFISPSAAATNAPLDAVDSDNGPTVSVPIKPTQTPMNYLAELGKEGRISRIGAWQIPTDWLQTLLDNNIFDPQQPFDEGAQRTAATLYRWDQTSNWRTDRGDLILGIGNGTPVSSTPISQLGTQPWENALAQRGWEPWKLTEETRRILAEMSGGAK